MRAGSLVAAVVMLWAAQSASAASVSVIQPSVNGEATYLGFAGGTPEFSWGLSAKRRATTQSAYRVVVGRRQGRVAKGRGDVWDSGKVRSPGTTGVVYRGGALKPRTRYFYAIRTWDDRGAASRWSAPGWFETGIAPSDWAAATWIGRDVPAASDGGADPRTSQLRREFSLARKRITRARVYATALGAYTLALNGRPVSDDRLAPGWTDYNVRVQTQTYDVTKLVRAGRNAIGAELSTGWYAGAIGNGASKDTYGSVPALLLRLEIAFADGTSTTVVSDRSWKTVQGPTVGADLMAGEYYDARRMTPGWDRPGFDDRTWEPVVEVTDRPAGAGNLVPQAEPPIRPTRELPARSVVARPGGAWIFDLGQNTAGVARLRVRHLPAGTKLTLRFGEALNPDGSLQTANLRAAEATDSYTARGGAVEEWTPKFTQHGFRYVEVSGYPGAMPKDAITGVVWGTDSPDTGALTTSDERLNRLIANAMWSQRSNFMSIPTDCPQRSERVGWTGDINMFAPTAALNQDVRRFLGDKWMADVRDAQTADGRIPVVVPRDQGALGSSLTGEDIVWSSAAVTVPYTMWQTYGDTQAIEENWEALTKFMTFWSAVPTTIFGDWAPPPASPEDTNNPVGKAQNNDAVALAWYKHDADMMAAMARATGRDEDAARYAKHAQLAATQFRLRYSLPDGTVHVAGLEQQTAYAVALAFDLLPEAVRTAAARKLAALVERSGDGWDLDSGFAGTPWLLPALSEHGQGSAAFTLLGQRDYPGWLYEVDKGATTIWEYWNAVRPDGTVTDSSLNHYAYGSVQNWMYAEIGGIARDPAAPGFANTIFRPQPGGGVTSASARIRTVRGLVASTWQNTSGGFEYDVTVPANATGTVHVPASSADAVFEVGSGKRVRAAAAPGVKLAGARDGAVAYTVGSGSYRFRVAR